MINNPHRIIIIEHLILHLPEIISYFHFKQNHFLLFPKQHGTLTPLLPTDHIRILHLLLIMRRLITITLIILMHHRLRRTTLDLLHIIITRTGPGMLLRPLLQHLLIPTILFIIIMDRRHIHHRVRSLPDSTVRILTTCIKRIIFTMLVLVQRPLLGRPWPLYQTGAQHFLPSMQALDIGATPQTRGNLLPILATIFLHGLT